MFEHLQCAHVIFIEMYIENERKDFRMDSPELPMKTFEFYNKKINGHDKMKRQFLKYLLNRNDCSYTILFSAICVCKLIISRNFAYFFIPYLSLLLFTYIVSYSTTNLVIEYLMGIENTQQCLELTNL